MKLSFHAVLLLSFTLVGLSAAAGPKDRRDMNAGCYVPCMNSGRTDCSVCCPMDGSLPPSSCFDTSGGGQNKPDQPTKPHKHHKHKHHKHHKHPKHCDADTESTDKSTEADADDLDNEPDEEDNEVKEPTEDD
ncbi:hypothetical protein OC846_003604 [Tilletia horrida]|uniref:Secreted protein n=1 Tax=Tilletia horrida TaxID=155126 RepID=A0AAN6JRK8_9BASI|nr:hypothetical protein OC846_003604 [Tilletia horrida]